MEDLDLPPGFSNIPPGFGSLPPGFGNLPRSLPNLPPGFSNLPPGFSNLPPGYGGPYSRPSPAAGGPVSILQGKAKRPRPKKVTWAAGNKLCDIRLFAAEDAPALAGAGHQDRLKVKMSKFMHAASPLARVEVPPGFAFSGEKQKPRRLVDDAAIEAVVAQVPWRRPSPFKLEPLWTVLAGEGSEEVKVQLARQVRFLEAVYPRSSSIPDSPAEPQEPPQEILKDDAILQIPVLPVEEDDSDERSAFPPGMGPNMGAPGQAIGMGAHSYAKVNGVFGQAPAAWFHQGKSPVGGFNTGNLVGAPNLAFPPLSGPVSSSTLSSFQTAPESGVPSAAAVLAEAVEKSGEAGSLIDRELLLNILNNPSLIQTLLGKNGSVEGSNLSQNVPGAPLVAHGVENPKPQESRVESQHSASAFAQHLSPPLAYPATQLQGGHMPTNWR